MAIPFMKPFTTIPHNAKLHSFLRPNKFLCCTPTPTSPTAGLEPGLYLNVATHVIPHPKKVDTGGEDACFVSSYRGGVIAVADGVSGWAKQDVNPALFSRELMANASVSVQDEEVNYDPRSLIRKAHAATSSVGSATVVVAMLETNGTLKIAAVGDCCLKVIRKGQILFGTYPQEHYFDCPYQLSSEAVGQTFLDAMVTTVELMEEDTIVMGSDGLFDNVFDREIVSVINSCSNVYDAAKELANLAHIHSRDSSFDSPFSQEARTHGIDVPWWKKIVGLKLTGKNMVTAARMCYCIASMVTLIDIFSGLFSRRET